MPTVYIAKYSIELFKRGGEGAGIEEILDRHADLKVARSIYRARVEQYPGRLIMLCDAPPPPTKLTLKATMSSVKFPSAKLAKQEVAANGCDR